MLCENGYQTLSEETNFFLSIFNLTISYKIQSCTLLVFSMDVEIFSSENMLTTSEKQRIHVHIPLGIRLTTNFN